MGTCDSCGKKGIFLKRRKCFICKDHICYNCAPKPVISIIGKKNNKIKKTKNFYTCQKNECVNELKNITDGDWKKIIGTDMDYFSKFDSYFDQRVKDILKEKTSFSFNNFIYQISPSAAFLGDVVTVSISYPPEGLLAKIKNDFINRGQIILAENLIECGRPLDAAKIYEQMHNYEKARNLRENDKRIIIKRTNVSLNLND